MNVLSASVTVSAALKDPVSLNDCVVLHPDTEVPGAYVTANIDPSALIKLIEFATYYFFIKIYCVYVPLNLVLMHCTESERNSVYQFRLGSSFLIHFYQPNCILVLVA